MKDEKNKKLNVFGLTEEDIEAAKKAQDILPVYPVSKLEEGQMLRGIFKEPQPREIEIPDKDNPGQKKKVLVIKVLDETGILCTMYLGSKSIKMGVFNLYKKSNDLLDIAFTVAMRMYEHKKFGDTRGYTVQEDATA